MTAGAHLPVTESRLHATMSVLALDLDRVLGDTRPLWNDWLEDASRRFASIAPLDLDALPGDRAEAAVLLDRWAERGVGDWRALLRRFAEERAPVHLRPRAATNALLRRLHASGATLGVFTDAPEPLAEVALTQLGLRRQIATLCAGERALERLRTALGPEAIVVESADDLSQAAE
jgi:phosphoglycolate phosphatase-like HAD superfamily hydrolase